MPADFVTEAPAPGVDHHRYLSRIKTVSGGRSGIVNFGHLTYLDEVIAATDGSQLVRPLASLRGDGTQPGATQSPGFLRGLQVFGSAVTGFHQRRRTPDHHLFESDAQRFVGARFAHTRRYASGYGIDEGAQIPLLDPFRVQFGGKKPDATVDIVPDGSRRDDRLLQIFLFGADRHDPAYGKAVSLV